MTKKAIAISTFAFLMANFMGGLDETIINTALPSIITDFNAGEELGLLTSIFLFTLAITTVLWGKVAEKIGSKKSFQLSTVVFVAASLFGGLAPSIWILFGARAVMGIGAGGMISIPFIIYAKLYKDAQSRTKALGLVTASYGLSIILGPVLGGWIVNLFGWHWTFFINIPIGILAIVLIHFFYSEVAEPSKDKQKIDFLGTVLLIFVLVLLLLAIDEGMNMSITLLGALIFIITLGLLVFWQVEKRAEDPIIPNELVTDFPYVAKNVMMMLFYGLSIGYTVYAPLWAQSILGTSASLGGATQILSSITVILATRMSPKFLQKISYKNTVWIGFSSVIISASILAMANVDSSYWTIVISGGFMGFGQGMLMPPLQVAMQNEVKPELLNIATTLSLLVRTFAMSLTASIYGSLLTSNIISGVANSLDRNITVSMVNGLNLASIQEFGADRVEQMRAILFSGLHMNFVVGLIAVLIAAMCNKFCWKGKSDDLMGT